MKHNWDKKFSIQLITLVMCLLCFLGLPVQATALIAIENGLLQGREADGVISFKGIPYAAPPIGAFRWRAPQPAKNWAGIRQASQFGHDCMQYPTPEDQALPKTVLSEDCLVLNIWRPTTASHHKLPVMVWIYGGGFVDGDTSADIYDGTEFAKRGVILVSFNYRVGRFGFFAHPALSKENADGLLGAVDLCCS